MGKVQDIVQRPDLVFSALSLYFILRNNHLVNESTSACSVVLRIYPRDRFFNKSWNFCYWKVFMYG